jgi:hypothetical protein
VYPEQEIEVFLPLQPSELWAPGKVRWVFRVWTGAVANCFLGHVPIAVFQGRQRRETAASGED